MNKVKVVILFGSLIFTQWVGAAIDPQENVLELSYAEVGVPAHEADRLTVQPCGNCAELELQYNVATAYRLDGFDSAPVTLQEFSQAVRRTSGKDGLLFYLSYNVDSLKVTELVLESGE